MQIKRFRAGTVKEALSMVKREFGPEALVLETKTIGPGLCEVVAAVEREGALSVPPLRGGRGISAEFLLGEMRQIKDLLVSVAGKAGDDDEDMRDFREELRSRGLEAALVTRLLLRVRTGKGREVLGSGAGGSGAARLRAAVRRELARIISVKDPLGDARVITFIGPTGAGKTTTLAKLAAMTKLGKKKKAAMITLDTIRIGAPDQIFKYGQMMGLPAGVASGVEDVLAFLKRHGDADLVLIDTPGAGPGPGGPMQDLHALASRVPGLRFNVVLSLRDRDESLYESVTAFGSLPVDSLTFTRLDETGACGQMLGVSVRSKKPIGLLSTGQKVPGDIVKATVEGVLGYLLPS